MENTRYIMQGGDFLGKPAEITTKEEPDSLSIEIFSRLYNAKKIKIYKAELELIEEIELGGNQK